MEPQKIAAFLWIVALVVWLLAFFRCKSDDLEDKAIEASIAVAGFGLGGLFVFITISAVKVLI